MPLTASEELEYQRLQEELGKDTLSGAGIEIEMNAINQSLMDDGLDPEFPDVVPTLSPHDDLKSSEDFVKLADDERLADIVPSELKAYQQQLVDNETLIEPDIGIEEQGFVDMFVELKRLDKVAERLPFTGPFYKFGRMSRLATSVRIVNQNIGSSANVGFFNPKAGTVGAFFNPSVLVTPEQKEYAMKDIEEWVVGLEKAASRTGGGKFADVLLDVPAFVIEFLLTGPIFKSGSAAGKQAATKILGSYADNAAGKLATRVAGAGFGTLARTSVNVPRILEGAASKMTEGIAVTDDGAIIFADAERNPWRALSSSFTDLYIENLTEIAGGEIGKGFKWVGHGIGSKFPVIGKFTQELGEKWVGNKFGRTMDDFFKVTQTKVGFHGVLEEFGEERLGDVLRVITGKQSAAEIIPDWEDMLIEAGVFTVIGGANLAANKIFRTQEAPKLHIDETGMFRKTQQSPADTVDADKFKIFNDYQHAFVEATKGDNLIAKINEQVQQDRAKTKDISNLSDAEFDSATKGVFDDIKAEEASKAVNVATKTKALVGNTVDAGVTVSNKVVGDIAMSVARAEDALGFLGKTGKKLQKDFREISFRTAVNVGTTSQNIKPWIRGLSKQEKVTVAQLIDGAIPEEGIPNRLIQRADAIRVELDKIQEQAIEVGLRNGGLTGRAFPQILNKEGKAFLEEVEPNGLSSANVFAWAQNKVNQGKYKTVDDAIIALQRYREQRLSGTEGYLEGTRSLVIDNKYREWNLDKILQGTIETSWEKIEAARQWGATKDGDFKRLKVDIEVIQKEFGAYEANAIKTYIDAQYGKSKAKPSFVKLGRAAKITQFVGKLAFSPLTITRNILDRYAKGLSHGTVATNVRASVKYPAFLNAWMKSAQTIEDQMIRRGAVLGHGHLSEGVTLAEGVVPLIAKPFAKSEQGNQTYIALVKKIQLESDIKRLMEMDGKSGVVSSVFNRMGTIVGQSQKQTRSRVLTNLTNEQLADAMVESKVSDEVMSEVLHRTVTDSAFPLTFASKRLWWGSRPVVQVATQFKVWSADHMRFMYKDVIQYGMKTGDFSRLARFILGTFLMGEIYNIVRDAILNKDESVLSKLRGGTRDEILSAIGNDLVDGGVIGFIADLTYGIGDWAAGPTVNTIAKAGEVFADASGIATVPEAMGKFLMNDVPALRQAQGILDNLDSIFEENNISDVYPRWQDRSFDFRKEQGDKIGDGWFIRAVRGTPKKKITERSLMLDMIARQVMVGDYDDAAQYIKRVVLDAEVDEVKNSVRSLQQSMRNNSPFGNISQDKIGLFLSQFSAEEAVNGIEAQQTWMMGYAKSVQIAFKELEAEGFSADLKQKALDFKAEMKEKGAEMEIKFKDIEEEIKRRDL